MYMLIPGIPGILHAQIMNSVTKDNLQLVYFGKRYSYIVPHVSQTFLNAMHFHRNFWPYRDTTTYVFLTDFEDTGHGGAISMPSNQVILGIEPYSFAFSIIPSNERFQWLFNHELTHIVLTDKPNERDMKFRKLLLGKVLRDDEHPVSAIWSYFTTPRWYAPRWYHEGIACFMETWMSGGFGRAMGYYDEMYFRSIIDGAEPLYSLIGLDTEGTTVDFQVGANSYLYGSRFITYLAYKYGIDKLKNFYARSDSSKAFYAGQFRKTYGRPVREVWEDWMVWENDFQQGNIARIKEFPLTEFYPLTADPLGSVSKFEYNQSTGKLYAAINHPGIISQIAEIDSHTGEIRKIATLDSPSLYYSTHLAYNAQDEKLYISEHNNNYRNLVEIDVKHGGRRTLNRLTRTGDLEFNPVDKCLWGVQNDNGYSSLVKIPPPYDRVLPVFSAPFGKVLFDLDISHSGDLLCASLSGIRGEQSLILFDLNRLNAGQSGYETVYTLDDNTLTQFRFSTDDRYLIGTSYYTGVSNVWRIKLEDKSFELLSNTTTGFFMPLQLNADSLLVLRYERDGMRPGLIPLKVLEDANAIDFLGNMVHQEHPVVEEWSLPPASALKGVNESIVEKPYVPLKEMKITGAYPDIAGFKNTVALGYRMNWRDPVGISNINLFVAISPWSPYGVEQKFHAMLEWKFWNWWLKANYNPTHFYDLFGPTKRSRAGYSAGVGYKRTFTLKSPLKYYVDGALFTYGMLEVLPGYQEIEAPMRNMQAGAVSFGISKLRKTLGGIDDETGFSWDISHTTYLAKGDFYPSFVSSQSVGFLVPFFRNTSFWIRNSIGQSLGDRASSLSHFYFGGFGNNYVDWQPSEQYRNALSFPGARIDEIPAYNYVKTMGELCLFPIRLKNVGTTWLYPTYIKPALFGAHLMTNFDRMNEMSHLFNCGGQVDIQLVLFSYLKTTWSFGYAKMFQAGKKSTNQFMLSLKLLGN
jgi:hypothetical protein